jgi:hypothetical protein
MPSVERINCHSEHWANRRLGEDKAKVYFAGMDEVRKRVVGLMAAILASLHMQTADDLFGGPQGSPRTNKLIAASIQWADRIYDED